VNAENVIEVAQPQSVTKSRTQRRSQRTRARLLKSALGLFASQGVDLTTIDAITAQADIGKGTFYRYFESKDELALELINAVLDQLCAKLNGIRDRVQDLDAALAAILDAHMAFFDSHRDEFVLLFEGRLLLKLERDEAETLEEPFAQYLRAIEAQCAPFLPHAVDAQRIRRLGCAVAGFFYGFYSFALIGMPGKEIDASLGPLKQAFVGAARSFLRDTTLSASAAGPAATAEVAAPMTPEQHPSRGV
jgi:AcrR family transcriptional regulator